MNILDEHGVDFDVIFCGIELPSQPAKLLCLDNDFTAGEVQQAVATCKRGKEADPDRL